MEQSDTLPRFISLISSYSLHCYSEKKTSVIGSHEYHHMQNENEGMTKRSSRGFCTYFKTNKRTTVISVHFAVFNYSKPFYVAFLNKDVQNIDKEWTYTGRGLRGIV